MNFLAHVYLSFESDEVLVGNFIADAVKGKEVLKFTPGIQKGILLHREIDHYTDSHEVVKEFKKELRPVFGKYAPVVSDIYFDHFLACSWHHYSTTPLADFAQYTYKTILAHKAILPEKVKGYLPYMIRENWLFNYSNFEGIKRVFEGMSSRARFD
ncbi:MAG TPA: ACP phosphodiesterase, partial [Cytophagaceae bacterium]